MEKKLYEIYNRESIIPLILSCLISFMAVIMQDTILNLIIFVLAVYTVDEIMQGNLSKLEEEMINKLPLDKKLIEKINLKARLRAIITAGIIYVCLNLLDKELYIMYLICGLAAGVSLVLGSNKYRNMARGFAMYVWILLIVIRNVGGEKLMMILGAILIVFLIAKGIYIVITKRKFIKSLFS